VDFGVLSYDESSTNQDIRISNRNGHFLYATVTGIEGTELLTHDLEAYARIRADDSRYLNIAIDPRQWRWGTSEKIDAKVTVQIGYFFQGQRPGDPDNLSPGKTPEWVTESFDIPVSFEINCDADNDGYDSAQCSGLDCDDNNADINPEMAEVCDGVDNDCDGGVDGNAEDAQTWYTDRDADGYGTLDDVIERCQRPGTQWALQDGDCNDTASNANPDRVEQCFDGLDNDCNGTVDDCPE